MDDGRCNRLGCKEIATHRAYLDLYPAVGIYEGAPAQLFFPDLAFCEEHAKALKQEDLIFPEQVIGMFHHLGRVAPDFSKTQVHTTVIQGEGQAC